MLYCVRMDVRPPHDIDPERFERLKAEEKAKAQELQRSGKWRHLWRVVGHYSNISIFDVDSHDELHAILSGLPLFPFMEMTITALTQQSFVHRLGSRVIPIVMKGPNQAETA
jgi:muconolactone D-isomerase